MPQLRWVEEARRPSEAKETRVEKQLLGQAEGGEGRKGTGSTLAG